MKILKLFLAIVLLASFMLTFFSWAARGFALYGDPDAIASILFLFFGLPCGIGSLLLFRSMTRT
jgi:hypothetical protein